MERDKRTHAVGMARLALALPHAFTMGAVGVVARLPMLHPFGLLWAYRHGAANMR